MLIEIGNIYFYECCVWFIWLKDCWFRLKGGYGKVNLDLGIDVVCRNWFRENDFFYEIYLYKVIVCY